jgi:hypothetical protein
VVEVQVEAWRVHDTGLVAVPARFRRLGGAVRHLRGSGDPWPGSVTLALVGRELRVATAAGPVGAWPLVEVSVRRVSSGPPVSFVVEVPGGAHLLAAAADEATESFLAALS